ncbi:SERTA domain-containing protein 2b [Periophthalmus magnuspinnatus]|uniref:SERTA domain-containing protein 2b n=1 Tax=Periophthalmus magnuspinnatus TaxID=409849 RepID=UPI00145BB982|nr:SERTA domain-containing protein 2b [Periophthalmus magnuspinnatus]
MFGKGHKRKLDEDEAGLEGKALEVAGSCPEGLSKVSYTLQRQTIFNISLMKLYTQRPGEPSLQRRVLINNMLRRIQDELKQDGTLRPLLLPPSPPPDDPLDEGYRQAPPTFGVLVQSQPSALLMGPPPLSPHPMGSPASPNPPPLPSLPPQDCPLEACLTPASLLEDDNMESMENATFSIATPPTPPVSPRPARFQSMEPDIATSRTISANGNTLTISTSQLAREHRVKPEPASVLQAELRLLDPLPTLPSGGSLSPDPPSSSPSGFLSDLALDDVLFADIDTSMYDFDPCTTTTTSTTTGSAAIATAVGGISKIAPVVTADDLIKSLASPYNGPAPQVSSNQPFKIDLTELDHIMEVLVGS